MTMTLGLRKFVLTSHITFSVGWFGSVAGFLALAIAGLTSQDTQIVRASYISMELIGWFVIIPACLGALLSGLVQSLGTEWGLFRHYWILVKFVLTILATLILWVHMQPISYVAGIASGSILSSADLRGLRIQLIADAGAALLVLLFSITLSVYKPWGRTPYGSRIQNKQNNRQAVIEPATRKSWLMYLMLGLIGLVVLLFVTLHLTGVFGSHGH